MEFVTFILKGTRAKGSVSFVVMYADFRQKPGVILKQELTEFTIGEVVNTMSF
jgi:hypothetical protein